MFTTQEISHPAYHDAVRNTDPCPISVHSFDRSKVEAFVTREAKRPTREVTVSTSCYRMPSGNVFTKFHAVSRPKVKDKACGLDRSGRGFAPLRERESEVSKAKRK